MALSQASIGTSVTVLYTSTGQSATTCLFACNITGAPVTFSLYLVPSGDTPGNGNIVLQDLSIPGGDTYMMNTEKLVLENGDTIQAVAGSSSAITASLSYVSV